MSGPPRTHCADQDEIKLPRNAAPRPDPQQPRQTKTPLISFHRFIPTARLPQRADRSAAGSLPTRAFRYCEPATSASGYGYYIFPPISFSLQWDGRDVMWTWEGAGTWLPLQVRPVPQFPRSVRPGGARGDPRIRAAVPRRPAGTGPDPALDRHRRPHRPRLEPAGARARQCPAQRRLRAVRGHHRDRSLVRPADHQYAADQDRRADRLPRGLPFAAGAASAAASPTRTRRSTTTNWFPT